MANGRKILILLTMLLNGLLCSAATGHLYTSDELSSGLITCICQDRRGFIWVGTEYGLNKFDGYRFTTYLYSRTDSTTITDNEVSTLFVDRDGQLWVGCSKGLARYNYDSDNFSRFHFPDNRTPRVNSLTQDHSGRMLIGAAGYGLYSYQEQQGYIHYENRFCKRHIDDFYSRMHLDKQGNLWRSSHIATITRFTLRNGQPASLRDYQSTCGQPMRFLEYGKNRLLIVCMHGILAYNYQTHEVDDAGFDLSMLDRSNISIEDATIDSGGNIYIATSGSGLMKIMKGSNLLTRVESSNNSIDLNTANVVAIMEDKDRNLWVGCYNKGLMLITSQPAGFSTWSLSDQHYRTGGGVSSITPGDEGNIWCTVQNSGVFRFDSEGRITAHPTSPTGTRLIFRGRDGQYWLTTENVLYRYNPYNGQATAELTLNGRGLNCIVDDNRGRLYISAYSMGLYVYDPVTRKGELLSMQQTQRKEGYLCNDWIKAMTFDSQGMLWICTTNGVSVMNPDGYVFNSYGWGVLLEGQQCFAACETADHNMLIGTESGLYCYNRKKRTTSEVPGSEALHDKMICAMVADQKGDIWISTTFGIWQYRQQQQQLIGHIAGNGLTTWEYMLGTKAQQDADRISFGTTDGLVTFRPAEVVSHQQQLGKAILTRITANGRVLNPQDDHFETPYTDNSFVLEFSTLDYKNTENIALQYRINGQETWQQASEGTNQLTFNQMQPGEYTIEVRTSASGIIAEQTTTIHITILKPWYKSNWAYLVYFLVIATFGALVAFSWNRYQAAKRLHLTIDDLKNNMHWLRSRFFGALEEKGDIRQVRVKGNNDALMERIVKCVNENLSNPDFSVEMLTGEVGISRAQLHRKMKEMTGLSTSEFIRNLRLEQAARLIREKKINITQVAYSIGFNNQAHFSTVFKKHFGMTPTEYAENGGS